MSSSMKTTIYITLLISAILFGYLFFSTDYIEYQKVETIERIEKPQQQLGGKGVPIFVLNKVYNTRALYRINLLTSTSKMEAHLNGLQQMGLVDVREWFTFADNEMRECNWGDQTFTKEGGINLDEDIELILESMNNKMITSCSPLTEVTR